MPGRLASIALLATACAVPTLASLGPKACDESHACAPGFSCVNRVCVTTGTVELDCADGVDDDGNGQTDCADPNCQDQSCDDGDLCTLGDVCNGGTCGGSAASCNNPGPCRTATG